MTYENMYDTLEYMKKNNLRITEELLNTLKFAHRLSSKDMAILKLPLEYIKIFIKQPNPELLEFLMIAHKKKYDFAKVTNYSYFLISPNNSYRNEYRKLLLKAFQNEDIFNSDFAMNLIINQIYLKKLEALIKACEIPEIRNNHHLLNIISSVKEAEEMTALTEAFKHEEIRTNPVAIDYLSKQKYVEGIITVTKALLNPNIKSNPQALALIARTENIFLQSVLYEACLNPKILKDFEFLTFLTKIPSPYEKVKIFVEAYSNLNPKEYQEFMAFYESNKLCSVSILESKCEYLIERRNLGIYEEKLNSCLATGDIEKFMLEYRQIANNPTLRRVKHFNIPTE